MTAWKWTLAVALAAAGVVAGRLWAAGPEATAQPAPRVFELRTYTTPPGKLDALHARFRDHTTALFIKHGMTVVGYWRPTDAKFKDNTLIYMLAYPSMDAHDKAWTDFRDDPEWKAVRDASEKDGKLTEKAESVLLTPTDFSPMQ